jgi:hypothetical protein
MVHTYGEHASLHAPGIRSFDCVCVCRQRGRASSQRTQHKRSIVIFLCVFPILLVSAGEARRGFNRRDVKAKETGFYLRET